MANEVRPGYAYASRLTRRTAARNRCECIGGEGTEPNLRRKHVRLRNDAHDRLTSVAG